MDDKQFKREQRFLTCLEEILDNTTQLEHDLNYFADYIGSEKLFEAKKHATAVYHILKKVEEGLKKYLKKI